MKQANKHRQHKLFSPSDLVWLSTAYVNISKLYPIPKLKPKWIGPFKVLQRCSDVVYKLDLPAPYKLFNKFHVSLLKDYHSHPSHPPPIPPPSLITGEPFYEVEQVLSSRQK